jgi:hypothetical protein
LSHLNIQNRSFCVLCPINNMSTLTSHCSHWACMDNDIFHYDPLAGTIKLVATEFRIFTGWHHKLVAVEFKWLAPSIGRSGILISIGWHQTWSQWSKTGKHPRWMKNGMNSSP